MSVATPPFDVIVVGGGATGGWAAKELCEGGLNVALVEAGPLFPEHESDGAAALRRRPVQARCYACKEETAHLFVDDEANPYEHPPDRPYAWVRGRQLGGRLHVWGRTSLRMSDHEFKAASRDGIGDDWPIGHADLAPAYSKVERFLGVSARPEGLDHLPDESFEAPNSFSGAERALKATLEKLWPTRILTAARWAREGATRTVNAAIRTRRLTIIPDAVVSRVLVDNTERRAVGIEFVDRVSFERHELQASAVILCASTLESTRILLNSGGSTNPTGLANSSGTLGQYLMDHTSGVHFTGSAPGRYRVRGERASNGGYIPGFRNISEHANDFARSYGIELQVHPAPERRGRRLRRRGGWYWVSAFGEVLPDARNRVTLSKDVDAWGIPTLHIDCGYGENERRMAEDQVLTISELLDAAGFDVDDAQTSLAAPGLSAHEMGTARMGADPSTSVLDRWNRSWDVPNLLVTDGACFTSGGYQNPTLTMMALTVRACARLVHDLPRS